MNDWDEFVVKVEGVEFTVRYDMTGPRTTGDEMELESMAVFIGDQEVTHIVNDKVMCRLEEECFKHYPDGPEPERVEQDEV